MLIFFGPILYKDDTICYHGKKYKILEVQLDPNFLDDYIRITKDKWILSSEIDY